LSSVDGRFDGPLKRSRSLDVGTLLATYVAESWRSQVALASIDVMVEIPQESRNKYEYDPKLQRFRLDRVLYASVHYPTDYGFVLDTVGADDDPLDALVIIDEPTFPGCIVKARPIGVLSMRDEHAGD